MKTFFIYPIIAVFITITACTATKITPEVARKNLAAIDNKDFSIKVNFANPIRMRQIALTSEYDLRIKNDSAFAYLPYYGVAHTAPLNPNEGGIKFSEPMKEYKSTPTRKNDGRQISFKINTGEYQYQINLSVYDNGSATVTVNSNQRDAITFYGEMK